MIKPIINYSILSICIFGVFSCNQNPEPETYLIPKGFQGRVAIIFNQKRGSPPKYENGRRIYEIPSNGICLSQFKPEYGVVDHRYFYIDSGGNTRPLPIYQYEHNTDGKTVPIVNDKNVVGIFSDGTTGQYAEGNNAPFQFFFVSTFNNLSLVESDSSFNNRVTNIL